MTETKEPDPETRPPVDPSPEAYPGVLAPIETAIIARGSDTGGTAAPIEMEDAATNRGTDEDAPQ